MQICHFVDEVVCNDYFVFCCLNTNTAVSMSNYWINNGS